jgi:hypothetical protein
VSTDWDAVWDRFDDEIRAIAAAGKECNPDLFFVCENFESPNFLFRAYAAFSLTSAHEEDLVCSFDCWRDGPVVRMSTDIARHGRQILADSEAEVVTASDSPNGSQPLQAAADTAVAFFRRHLDTILDEICPRRRR